MESIRVAAVSINSPLGQVESALRGLDHWTREAVDQGAELVLFPELQIHGHCTPHTWQLAEAVPDGPSTREMERIAREYGAFPCVGLSEKEHDIVFNTQLLEADLLDTARAMPNYTLRTRRPELYGDLVREQVTW